MKALKDFFRAWLAEFKSARAVQATIALTCAMTLVQVIGRTSFNIDLYSTFEVRPTTFVDGEVWRPLTANFVHLYGLSHLALNMLGLALAGPFVESDYGSLRFVAIYVLSGYAAWSVHAIQGWSGSGASAAVVGPFAALLVSSIARYADSTRARRLVALAALLSVAWIGGGFLIDDRVVPLIGLINIANDVHVVGFIFGLLLGCIGVAISKARDHFEP